jgi:hypothetical protein
MQFVEANSFELVSAVHELERRDEPLRFVLFPMIHIGERSYYEDVAARASRCDLLLVEGVPSVWARIATRAYGLFAARLGLVTQRELNLRTLGPKIVNTDMTADEFNQAYSRLPILAQAILPLLLPLYGLYFLFNGSRERIAKQIETTDLPLRERILEATEETDALERLLLGRRDRMFLNRLQSVFDESRGKSLTVGIIYGAGHMPAIFRYLSQHLGYRVSSSSWAPVFSLV